MPANSSHHHFCPMSIVSAVTSIFVSDIFTSTFAVHLIIFYFLFSIAMHSLVKYLGLYTVIQHTDFKITKNIRTKK